MPTRPIVRHTMLGCVVASLALLAGCGGDSAQPNPTQPTQKLPDISAIHVLPSAVEVAVGEKTHVQASALGLDSLPQTGRTYTFVMGDSRIATFDNATGAVTGVSAGTTTLTVTTASKVTVVPISVATLGQGTFSIDLRFGANVSPTLRIAALAAVRRWENVIIAPLVPYFVQADTGLCDVKQPAVNELVPNMIVYVRGDSIDGPGNIAGEGGPCIIRDDQPETTALGTLIIDTADVASAQRQDVLVDLLTHEIGHIIGIGTLWGPASDQVPAGYIPNTATGLGTADPEFIGRSGRIASAELGFTSDSSKSVPIENSGGPGTADGHWRESIFSHELMTGTLDSDGNPLSLVTVEALADLGYTVLPEAAEDFSSVNATSPLHFGGASATILPYFSTPYRIGEILLRPKHKTMKNGLNKPAASSRTQSIR